jgi:vacuolar-type H+-ATPase subunit H
MKTFLLTVTILFFVNLPALTAQPASGSPLSGQSSRRNEIVSIFKQAASLNKKFEETVGKVSTDSLNVLREIVEEFSENYVDSARTDANRILQTENDSVLLCAYLRYVVSYKNSAEEAISWDIAALFIENPSIFLTIRCKFTKSERSYLKKTLSFGLENWRYETKYTKQQIDSATNKLKQF